MTDDTTTENVDTDVTFGSRPDPTWPPPEGEPWSPDDADPPAALVEAEPSSDSWFATNADGSLTHTPPQEPDQGVSAGSFSRALGMPIEEEDGSGIEVHRADFTEVLADSPPRNSVSISLWRGVRCTTLDQSWDAGDNQDYLDALRALALQAEELVENERL